MMIKFVILLIVATAVCNALVPLQVTGTTPPPVRCPNSMCKGKPDGNYEYRRGRRYKPNYFLQCVSGLAYCQACFPLRMEFSAKCNQCLYSKQGECVTTQRWEPATTFYCPDVCSSHGPKHSGNVADPQNTQQYVACWQGITVGCVACPGDLEFNEEWNACLYEGIYKTRPSGKH